MQINSLVTNVKPSETPSNSTSEVDPEVVFESFFFDGNDILTNEKDVESQNEKEVESQLDLPVKALKPVDTLEKTDEVTLERNISTKVFGSFEYKSKIENIEYIVLKNDTQGLVNDLSKASDSYIQVSEFQIHLNQQNSELVSIDRNVSRGNFQIQKENSGLQLEQFSKIRTTSAAEVRFHTELTKEFNPRIGEIPLKMSKIQTNKYGITEQLEAKLPISDPEAKVVNSHQSFTIERLRNINPPNITDQSTEVEYSNGYVFGSDSKIEFNGIEKMVSRQRENMPFGKIIQQPPSNYSIVENRSVDIGVPIDEKYFATESPEEMYEFKKGNTNSINIVGETIKSNLSKIIPIQENVNVRQLTQVIDVKTENDNDKHSGTLMGPKYLPASPNTANDTFDRDPKITEVNFVSGRDNLVRIMKNSRTILNERVYPVLNPKLEDYPNSLDTIKHLEKLHGEHIQLNEVVVHRSIISNANQDSPKEKEYDYVTKAPHEMPGNDVTKEGFLKVVAEPASLDENSKNPISKIDLHENMLPIRVGVHPKNREEIMRSKFFLAYGENTSKANGVVAKAADVEKFRKINENLSGVKKSIRESTGEIDINKNEISHKSDSKNLEKLIIPEFKNDVKPTNQVIQNPTQSNHKIVSNIQFHREEENIQKPLIETPRLSAEVEYFISPDRDNNTPKNDNTNFENQKMPKSDKTLVHSFANYEATSADEGKMGDISEIKQLEKQQTPESLHIPTVDPRLHFDERPLKRLSTDVREMPLISDETLVKNSIVTKSYTHDLPKPLPIKQFPIAENLTFGSDMIRSNVTPNEEKSEFGANLEVRPYTFSTALPSAFAPQKTELAHIILRQVQEALPRLVNGTLEVSLNPEELGTVRIQMHQSESGLIVNIQADRPETLELLKRHIDQLARNLSDLGEQASAFTFGEQSKQRKSEQHHVVQTSDPESESAVSNELDPQLPQQDGLDIRL